MSLWELFMSSRGNRPETEIEKQLKKLGFPDPKEREKKEKKERLVKKINLEFGINVDANETYEALNNKYYKLRKKRQKERQKEEELNNYQRELEKKNRNRHRSQISLDAISSAFSSDFNQTVSAGPQNFENLGINNFEKFKLLEINHNSSLNPQLLQNTKPKKNTISVLSSNKTQKYSNSSDGVDLVMGIDFGTTYTKVVIQETGSGKSWAIPFTEDQINSYLLQSNVFLTEKFYSLDGDNSQRISELKMPLIEGNYSDEHLEHVYAYLALVIRHARSWFLDNVASTFYGNEFDWFYKMGLPAENHDKKELVSIYKLVLTNAVKLSLASTDRINQTEIDSFIQTNTANNIEHYCNVHPEIQAQLGGYTRSDRWDSRRVKVMMVDIGGGTVDASIINVTKHGYEEQFNCLKTKVSSLGVYILHKLRLDWLEKSAYESAESVDGLIQDIKHAKHVSINQPTFPDTIMDYIDHAKWPDDFSIDKVFYEAFRSLVYEDIIAEVKTKIDIRNSEQWKNLHFILCGGGSLHSLYKIIKSDQNLDIVVLQKPSILEADIRDEEYHRLSVAYGLSFMEQGWFVNPSEIEPMAEDAKSTDYRDNFIDKDMV